MYLWIWSYPLELGGSSLGTQLKTVPAPSPEFINSQYLADSESAISPSLIHDISIERPSLKPGSVQATVVKWWRVQGLCLTLQMPSHSPSPWFLVFTFFSLLLLQCSLNFRGGGICLELEHICNCYLTGHFEKAQFYAFFCLLQREASLIKTESSIHPLL